jgi:hypothetical protein
MVVKFLSGSDSCDDEDNINDGSDMQHGTWAKVGAQWTCFPFNSKPGLIVDIEDHNNSLDHFELLVTPGLVKLINRETNQYAQQFLENS